MENINTITQIFKCPLIIHCCLLAFFFIHTTEIISQQITTNKKSKKFYLKAEEKYKLRDFETALKFLRKSSMEDPSFTLPYLQMAKIYQALGQIDSSYKTLSKYINTSRFPSTRALQNYSAIAFDRGHYEQAQNSLDKLLKQKPSLNTNREISLLSKNLHFVKKQLQNHEKINVKKLDGSINKYKLQYLPTITVDQSTMVFTKRDSIYDDEDIVISHKSGNIWSEPVSISSVINTPLNEGACTISADGRKMIFTSCDRSDSRGSCDLYVSEKNGEQWTKPSNLGSNINTKYWESQPSLSADGKILYFSSNRPGGLGGKDLWMSKQIDGKWQLPKNLSPDINTFKDEITPFIHPNGVTLYFSSTGHVNMGGFDLFKTTYENEKWNEPTNLGYPINTHRDEVALLITGDGKTAYFTQEKRKHTQIENSDLVSFELPPQLRAKKVSYVMGHVIDANTKKNLKAQIEIVDIKTNKMIYNNHSDSITGIYTMVLPSEKLLAGYVKKKGYLYSNFQFATKENSIQKTDTLLIKLEPINTGKQIVLKNIYFSINSYELDNKSNSEIQNAFQLLKENNNIIVLIKGHTDDIGSEEYNKKLSFQRATSVRDALVKKGIDKKRIYAEGYGSTQPKYPNTNSENRKKNRRIAFEIIK